jgi:hypothetical protein
MRAFLCALVVTILVACGDDGTSVDLGLDLSVDAPMMDLGVDGPMGDGPVLQDGSGSDAGLDSGTDLTADGPATDGPAADGPGADGPMGDGPTADGPSADGPAADGPVPDQGQPDSITCSTGLTLCGSSCVDLQSDTSHCGTCNNACEFDESCVATVCTVKSWSVVGAVNPSPGPDALAHALGTDGTALHVAWVADLNPTDEVRVHKRATGAWSQVGAALSTSAQPVVDLQFDGAKPHVLYMEGFGMGNMRVQTFESGAWGLVGSPGYQAPCVMMFNVALWLEGATPHLAGMGAGGCGIGVVYAYWTGSAWWETPNPPSPMGTGLLTMNGGGSTDVTYGTGKALVALMDNGARHVRYWDASSTTWADVGGSLNMGPANPSGFAGDLLSITVDAAGTPIVAFSEEVSGTRGVYVKKLSSTGVWQLVGTDRISGTNDADQPSISVINSMPHVAYVEQSGGVGKVQVRRWNGSSWQRVGAALNSSATSDATSPYLVGQGLTPYVAFREPATGPGRIHVVQAP